MTSLYHGCHYLRRPNRKQASRAVCRGRRSEDFLPGGRNAEPPEDRVDLDAHAEWWASTSSRTGGVLGSPVLARSSTFHRPSRSNWPARCRPPRLTRSAGTAVRVPQGQSGSRSPQLPDSRRLAAEPGPAGPGVRHSIGPSLSAAAARTRAAVLGFYASDDDVAGDLIAGTWIRAAASNRSEWRPDQVHPHRDSATCTNNTNLRAPGRVRDQTRR